VKTGAVPYWSCGGEVLTRALDTAGQLVARPVATHEARQLIGFYVEGSEATALRTALAAAAQWRRAAVGARTSTP
jgi:hypothetical protein